MTDSGTPRGLPYRRRYRQKPGRCESGRPGRRRYGYITRFNHQARGQEVQELATWPDLLVTTTDGAQYQFGVKLDRWSADIANALTARGCEVRTVPRGMAVTPGNTPSGWGDLPPSHHERGVR